MNPTAAILVVGDEILSGRTRDSNLHFLAGELTRVGIDLREARVVADDHGAIVAAVRALLRHDHVFTSGGIGPTHDDITADAVAEALGAPIGVREDARALLQAHYDRQGVELNEARLRMARVPEGAALIDNPVSAAPGFSLGHVHVMAGVPRIMRSMFEALAPTLERGRPVLSRTVHAHGVYEGNIADGLAAIQERHPALDLGSYPYYRKGGPGGGVALVAKGTDGAEVEAAAREMAALLRDAGGEALEGEPQQG